MKIRNFNGLDVIICICISLAFIVRGYTDALIATTGNNGPLDPLKYIFFIGAIIVGIIKIIGSKYQVKFKKELKTILLLVAFFAVVSLFLMLVRNQFQTKFIEELLYIILSILFAFVIINCLDNKKIYMTLAITLPIIFLEYLFFEIGIENFTLKNIFNSSFSDSKSVFESNFSAGTAFALCCYFLYNNKHKIITILSLFFVFLTFKRILLVIALILFIITVFFNKHKKINKKWSYIMPTVVLILSIGYFIILKKSLSNYVLYEELMDFTVMRVKFFADLVASEYKSFGLGSSILQTGKNLEMDFIKIYMEMGIIGLAALLFAYWKICPKNLYCYILLFGFCVNLCISHGLQSCFTWGLLFLLFASINCEEDNNYDEMSLFNHFKIKRRQL